MPTERPTLPQETHAYLLRRGESKGLGLQAGEVAWTGENKRYFRSIKLVAGVLVLAIFVLISSQQ